MSEFSDTPDPRLEAAMKALYRAKDSHPLNLPPDGKSAREIMFVYDAIRTFDEQRGTDRW